MTFSPIIRGKRPPGKGIGHIIKRNLDLNGFVIRHDLQWLWYIIKSFDPYANLGGKGFC